MKKHFKAVLVISSCLFVLFLALVVVIGYGEFRAESDALLYEGEEVSPGEGSSGDDFVIDHFPVSFPYISRLDGLAIDEQEGPVVAVMIENHPKSRPQQEGLGKASIVYETMVEGGITRFLALFSHENSKWVGPIRSARPYFVDIAKEYRAAYVHAGGSSPSLSDLVGNHDVLNIEALYWEEVLPQNDLRVDYYFLRDKNYSAPHDLFGSFAGIHKIIEDKNWKKKPENPRFVFGDVSDGGERADRIVLHFSDESFDVRYVYDEFENTYLRYLAGDLHQDGTTPITPTNILVQLTDYRVIDEEGRLEIRTTGTGDAYLFTGGKRFSGTWRKKSDDFTRFYDEDGVEFVLQPGQTWIEILDDEEKMEVVSLNSPTR